MSYEKSNSFFTSYRADTRFKDGMCSNCNASGEGVIARIDSPSDDRKA